ncbi:MAG: nucleotide exchange factor GrpE [Candidatus Hydrothermarchaeales archaeon]
MQQEVKEGLSITKKDKSVKIQIRDTRTDLVKKETPERRLPTVAKKEKREIVSLKDEITTLKESLDEKTKQTDEFLGHLQRLQADFENFKKNAEKDKAEYVKYASEGLIKDLIDVYENLERAIENGKESDNTEALLEGVEITFKQMKNIMEKEGLEPINALGEKLDPYKHEVLLSETRKDLEEGTILEEIQRGYTLNKKVIKYSKVKISKKE